MANTPTARLFALVVLVAGAVLGSVYIIGRSVGAGTSHPSSLSAPAPTHSAPPVTTSPSARAADPDPDDPRPPLPPEAGGPSGSRMTTGSRHVALTFDDGPDPTYTPQILAMLRAFHVKATFCVIGQNVAAHPELVRAIAADGHTLCNHSWDHDLNLGSRSPAVIRADLTRTSAAIRGAAPGAAVKYFRQPGGNWTPAVVAVARQLGMSSLDWEVDPRDWSMPGSASIIATVTSQTEAGSIVLMHDGGGNRQGSVNALRTIIPELTSRFQLTAMPTKYSAAAYAAAATPTPTPEVSDDGAAAGDGQTSEPATPQPGQG